MTNGSARWIQWLVTVLISLSVGLGSAAGVLTRYVERVATLEAEANFQRQTNLAIETRLVRMEGKIDRISDEMPRPRGGTR